MTEQRQLAATTFSPPSPPRRRVHAGTTPHKKKGGSGASSDRDPSCGAGDGTAMSKSTSGGGPVGDKENQRLGVHNSCSSMAQNSTNNDASYDNDDSLPAKSPGMDVDATVDADQDNSNSNSDRSLSMVLSPDGSQYQQPQQQLCAATSDAIESSSAEDSPALAGADGGRLVLDDLDLDLSGVSSITGGRTSLGSLESASAGGLHTVSGKKKKKNNTNKGRLSMSSAKSSGTGGTSSVLMGMNFLSPSTAITPGAITPKPSAGSPRTATNPSASKSAGPRSGATNKNGSNRRTSTSTLPSTPGFASPPRMSRPNFLMSPSPASAAAAAAARTPGSSRAGSVLRMMQAKSCADADGSAIVGNGDADEIGRDAADERDVEDNGAMAATTTQEEDGGMEEEKKEEEEEEDWDDADDEDMFLPNAPSSGSNVEDEDDGDVNSTEQVVSDLAHDVPTILEGVEDTNSSSDEESSPDDDGGDKESELATSTDDHQMTVSVDNEVNADEMPFPDDSADDDYDPLEDDVQSSPSRPSVLDNADIDPMPSRPTTTPTAAAQPAVQNVLAELPAETDLLSNAVQRSATKTPRVVAKKIAASPSPAMATPAPGLPFGEVRVGEAPIFSPLSFHGGTMATAAASTGSASSPSIARETKESSGRYFVSSTGLGAANGDNNENSGIGKVRKARPSVGSLSRAGRASIGGAGRRRSVASATDGIGILGMLGTAPACTNEPLVEQENEDDSSDGGGGSADDSSAKDDESASSVQEEGARENSVVDDESSSLKTEQKNLLASGGEDEVEETTLKSNSESHLDEECDKSMAESNVLSSPKCRRATDDDDDDDDVLEASLDQTSDIDAKKEEEDASSSSYSDSGDDDSEDSDDETESEVSSSCSSSASADVSIVLPNRKNKQRVRGARRAIQASDEDSDASYHIGSSSDDAKDEDEEEDALVYDDDKGDDGSYTIGSDEEDEEDDDVLIYESDESSVKAKPKRRTGAKSKARTVIVESEEECDESVEDQEESIAEVEKSLAAISTAASQTGEEDETVVEAEVVDEDQEVTGEDAAPSEEIILRTTDELFVAAVDKDTITVRDIFRSIEERFSMSLDKPTKKTIKSRLVVLINEEVQPVISGDRSVEMPSTAGQVETSLTSVSSQEGSAVGSSLVGSRKNSVRKGKWTRGAQLGVGSFGVVHMGMNQINGEMMAVKTLNLPDEEDLLADIEREVHLMRTLEHPNIVRYLGCERDRTHSTLAIFQQWVPGGSVSSLLRKFGPFPLPVIRKYLYQICTGLAYLHDNGIIHRDIKGSNILVTDDGVCKLADFGNSRRLGSDMEESLSMRGTPYFMAPEAFDGQCGMKSDIWSFGGVAVQMCSGLPPWKGSGVRNLHELICLLKKSDGPPSLPENIDKMLQDLIRVCFQRDPSQRPSAKDLFLHAIFAEADESSTVISGDSSFGMKSPSTKNRNCRNRQNGGDGESYHWPEYDKSQWPEWATQANSPELNPFARKR